LHQGLRRPGAGHNLLEKNLGTPFTNIALLVSHLYREWYVVAWISDLNTKIQKTIKIFRELNFS
jgi:hypothetical protein